jgi:molecular chaperone IbpA
MTRFNLNTLTPYSVGFDRMFDRLLELEHGHDGHPNNQGFPPYNIRRSEDEFFIDIALAGLAPEDIDIEHKENVLTVKSNWTDGDGSVDGEYLHRGISRKKFTRKFTLTDDIEVKGADFTNGLLTISLERIIPEEKRPKKIAINSTPKKKGKKELLVD